MELQCARCTSGEPCVRAIYEKIILKSSFQAVGQDLLDNEAILEAVNQDALDLLQELRQGEGLVDMLGFEEQLRLVNETWSEAKFQVQIEYHFSSFLGLSYSNIGKALLRKAGNIHTILTFVNLHRG